MKVSKSSSGILSSGGAVVASDLTVDGSTVTVDETNNRLGVNTDAPLGTVGVDGDLYFQPSTISTSHVYTDGSLDIRCTDNLKIGTDGADSVKIGRTNTALAKVTIRSGGENDLVVSNSMVGIGTETPTQALELDGNIQLSPSAISTAHIFTDGSLDLRATANIKIGTDGADSVKIGRTNTGAAKCHVRSGGENDLVVSNSMVGIGTDSPDHTLSVAGDIDLTGGLSFDGGTAVTSIDTDLSSVSGSDDTLASAKAIGAQLDTKSPIAGSGSIVTVGALNSGSITSGFGNIDVGSSTIDTTGAVGTGSITAAGDITATGGDLTLGTAADSADTTIKAADESGTNTAGKKLTISGGLGTGNAVPGAVEINVGIPGGSGSSVQSATLAIKATAEGTSTYFGGIAGLANDAGVGDVAVFGTEDGTDTLAAGRLMCMNSSGVWKYADADAEATTNGLLAIALGTAVSDGLLLRGFFKLNSYIEGSFSQGQPVYVSEAAGEIDFTRPSAAGDFVRVLGHATSETNVIWFSPSGDWLAL